MKKTLYVTKYCLTKGIITVTDELLADNGSYYYGKLNNEYMTGIYYKNKDIFDNLDDARIYADTQRLKKIMQLEKHINKLKNKKF